MGIIAAALALAGCTVGPNYRAPDLPAPASFAEQPPEQAGQHAADLAGWWQGYHDPELDRLVAMALADGLDIKAAAARIAQARAEARVARAAFFPQVNADGNFNYEKLSKNSGFASLAQAFGGGAGGGATSGGASGGGSAGGITLPGNSIKTFSLGFDASWEIDLFGGVRRSVEGARARVAAAEWSGRDAQVSLVAEVVDAYLQVRLAQARETVATQEVRRQARELQILGETARVGLVPEENSVRQRAQLAQAQASLAPIVAEGKAQMHALAVLVARPPDALIGELSIPRPALPPPPLVPPGLPADLLRRRPDVRAAERQLAAATADIGVAVADLYPRITLTGMGELISTALGNLFTADSFQATGAAAAMFPILDFGRRKGTVAARRAAADLAYVQYQQTVLGALRDVEDALIRIRTEQARNQALRSGVADAERGVQSISARFRTGLTDQTSVLDAQASVLSARDGLAQSDAQLRRDLLSLYKALGGGWEGMPALVAADGGSYVAGKPKKQP